MSKTNKVLITGSGGLLGSEFKELKKSNFFADLQMIPLTHSEVDINSKEQVEKALKHFKPDFLINCAAYTNVDLAESEREVARKTNAIALEILAKSCRQHRVKLIHYSTDFVFDGEKKSPYVESDLPNPLNYYGVTKLEGEKIVRSLLPVDQFLILRICWPYGKNGKNFIHSLMNLSKTKDEIRVVTDQIGTPNPAFLLAQKTIELMDNENGLFHLSCHGSVSRFELISFLFEKIGSSCRVLPATTVEFPSPAKRPAYSAIATEREDLKKRVNLPDWKQALSDYLSSL